MKRLVPVMLFALALLAAAGPAAMAQPLSAAADTARAGLPTNAPLWTQTFAVPDAVGGVRNTHVAVARTGDVYVAGVVQRPVTGADWVIVGYTSTGSFKWVQYYGTAGSDSVFAVTTDRSGNVIVAGTAAATANGAGATVKYSAGGKLRWARTGKSKAGEYGTSDALTDAAGNVYTTGTVFRSTGGSATFTTKYSPRGRRLWQRYYSTSAQRAAWEGGAALAFGPDDRLYVAATVGEPRSTYQDAGLLCYSKAGRLLWSRRTGTPGRHDYPSDIAVRKTGVCVAGAAADGEVRYGLLWKVTLRGKSSRPYLAGAGTSAAPTSFKRAGIDTSGRVFGGGDSANGDGRIGTSVTRYGGAGDIAGAWVSGTADASFGGMAVTAAGKVYVAGMVPRDEGDLSVWAAPAPPDWGFTWINSWGAGDEGAEDLALGAGAFYVSGWSGASLLLQKYAQ